MAKIAFDVKYRPQIESGEYKVETRDGRPVRIVCWDVRNDKYPIIALVDFGEVEKDIPYTLDGYYWENMQPSDKDLFIVTIDQKLTEFEAELCGVLDDWADADEMYPAAYVKKCSPKLLDLARKQIEAEVEEQKQQEVDLDEEVHRFFEECIEVHEVPLYGKVKERVIRVDCYEITARHFYELGLNAKKERSELKSNSKKRLPTIEEWRSLIDNCTWKWDDERKGQVVTAKNGNSIFLPAAGYRNGTHLYNAGSYGLYWSSSLDTDYPSYAYCVRFYSDFVDWDNYDRYNGHSVRLVSDIPQEGFVDMGNGLYWSEQNEEGYYTYGQAMKLYSDAR